MVELGNGVRFFFDFGSGCMRNMIAMQVPHGPGQRHLPYPPARRSLCRSSLHAAVHREHGTI
jgi:hypothetical protein